MRHELLGEPDEDSVEELFQMWTDENLLRLEADAVIARQKQVIDIQKTTIARLRRKVAKLQIEVNKQ